jgi:dihydropteroate synthase
MGCDDLHGLTPEQLQVRSPLRINQMKSLTIGSRTLNWGERTWVMGILNLTPDSFSGDGLLAPASLASLPSLPLEMGIQPQTGALEQARRFLAAGADILDVGGESTRPGSQPVDASEELRRVISTIRLIASEFPHALISIDTCKAAVAEAAFEAGARILNDVWGLRADPDLAGVAARAEVPVVLMHNRSTPANIEVRERLGNAYVGAEYQDLLEDVKRELMDSVQIARSAGIPDEHIILDPGLGFGKTVQQNLELINRLGEIRELGFPLLLGPSRKSFIGYTLDLPPDQRLEGTAAAVAVGITRGADIVRVHDVEYILRVVRMTDAILHSK